MIFTEENIELIRQGKKTETRRIWKKPHVKIGKIYQCRVSRYQKTPDDSPEIKILSMHKEKLKDITLDAIQREGFECTDTVHFINLWIKLHGEWNPDQEVWVIDFEVVK